jgi:hypothetical protein
MKFYDKPFYLSCVVQLSTYKSNKDEVAKFLTEKYGAKELTYPFDFVNEIVKELTTKGYPRFKTLPVTLTAQEAIVLLAKCLQKFNNQPALRIEPNAVRLNKEMKTAKDFIRIIEELLLQQDSISLSQIFQTMELPKVVFTNTNTILNSKFSRTVIDTLPELTEGKKKSLEQLLEGVSNQVNTALVHATSLEKAAYEEGKYQLI